MLIIFILFTVIHVSNTLYGPGLLIRHVGGSVTIKCYYVPTSVNRHDRKFLCNEMPNKACQTIISSRGFINQNYKERVSMYNNPQQGILHVTIRELKKKDSSYYRCAIGKTHIGLYARVNLTILEANKGQYLPKSPQIVWGKLTGSVELQCPSETPGSPEMKKFLCKMKQNGCFPREGKSKNSQQSHRIIMANGNSSGTFSVTINDLKRQDAGVYVCGTRTLGKNANVKTIQLQTVEESVFYNILSDTQTTYESQTTPLYWYWHVTSTDDVYKERVATQASHNNFPLQTKILEINNAQRKMYSQYSTLIIPTIGTSPATELSRSSHSEQNLLAIVIPVLVLLLLLPAVIILVLVKIRQRKTGLLNILSKSPEGEMRETSQKVLEEHTQNESRNSADEDGGALNSNEDVSLSKLGNIISASARKQPSSESTRHCSYKVQSEKKIKSNATITVYCLVNPEDSSKNDCLPSK